MNLLQNLRERLLFALGEGVGGVAVGTAEVAAGQPDENARQPGKGAFALQAQINLIDDNSANHGPILKKGVEN